MNHFLHTLIEHFQVLDMNLLKWTFGFAVKIIRCPPPGDSDMSVLSFVFDDNTIYTAVALQIS